MKLESLNSALFTPVTKDELKAIKGGEITNTSGEGTIKIGNENYSYNGDVKDGNKTGYWIPKLVKYHWV